MDKGRASGMIAAVLAGAVMAWAMIFPARNADRMDLREAVQSSVYKD